MDCNDPRQFNPGSLLLSAGDASVPAEIVVTASVGSDAIWLVRSADSRRAWLLRAERLDETLDDLRSGDSMEARAAEVLPATSMIDPALLRGAAFNGRMRVALVGGG